MRRAAAPTASEESGEAEAEEGLGRRTNLFSGTAPGRKATATNTAASSTASTRRTGASVYAGIFGAAARGSSGCPPPAGALLLKGRRRRATVLFRACCPHHRLTVIVRRIEASTGRVRRALVLVLVLLTGAAMLLVIPAPISVVLQRHRESQRNVGSPGKGSSSSGGTIADNDERLRRSVRVEPPPPPPRVDVDEPQPKLIKMKEQQSVGRGAVVEEPHLVLPRKSLPPPYVVKELEKPDSVNDDDSYNYNNMYTVRINSWKRQDQLRLAIQHLMTCGGTISESEVDDENDNENASNRHHHLKSLAEIQVVWCTAQGPPPEWLLQLQQESRDAAKNSTTSSTMPRVTVELHDANSLNERFHVSSPLRTAAILSVDDDVMRPCIALDAAFLKWKRQPHRMVGFDARTIVVKQDGDGKVGRRLQYGYLTTTERTNRYSLTLSRFAFVHAHYLRTYMSDMPSSIREDVDRNLNCEDIAMSLWVSYQTDNLPPLLADYWVIKSMVKLESLSAISSTNNHKSVRDQCVEDFVQRLQLSVSKLDSRFVHYHTESEQGRPDHFWFDCGADESDVPAQLLPMTQNVTTTKHLQKVHETVEHWKQGSISRGLRRDLNNAIRAMSHDAYLQGYLKNTDPWRAKFRSGGHDTPKADATS